MYVFYRILYFSLNIIGLDILSFIYIKDIINIDSAIANDLETQFYYVLSERFQLEKWHTIEILSIIFNLFFVQCLNVCLHSYIVFSFSITFYLSTYV